MKRIYNFHPLLFSTYPIVSLWSINIEYIPFSEIVTSILISFAISLVLLLVVRLSIRDWDRAALITSVALFLFFSYGYASSALKRWFRLLDPTLVIKILPLVWFALFFFWVWFVIKKLKDVAITNQYFLVSGCAILMFSLVNILHSAIAPSFVNEIDKDALEDLQGQFSWQGESQPPDIFYIILDGYAREDILLDLYNYDNSEFIGGLQDRGFYIASRSFSNYCQTTLSITSSTNMIYINYLEKTLGHWSENKKPLIDMIFHSKVRQIFEANGYTFVNIPSGYVHTDITDATLYLDSNEKTNLSDRKVRIPNAFEWMLYETTGFKAIFDVVMISSVDNEKQQPLRESSYWSQREVILNSFDHLDDVTNLPGNFFVFAHILAPHPPFVFDEAGNAVQSVGGLTLADGSDFIKGNEDLRNQYIQGYVAQLKFVNFKTIEAIDLILRESQNPPIIIIQADHGPGAYLDWNSADHTNIDERFSILNGYYFPDGNYEDLYPSITPVNSFRVILNTYFDGHFEILDDLSYFSLFEQPYSFIDVNERLNK